ncbi:molybdopterin converting factor, subunit 1 [Parvularcula bermudensis HTCC2503]|uniref:Molybdopterin converting factor, subunit 1 n=1 Tax=Parvularcula bermudensis (strain ATCC BAA-594 / HTCC2503 / KCTC 12087) TaxID=314260 RepID=E0THH4_PARBH|nr:MoaD/ThiS family protein [Parvularcula bermudensis]ADM10766.1 molybdopterin converting factor, subunit 1 [Parvularcula bermudensis HTCC2503]
MVRVLFFGRLGERFGAERDVEVGPAATVADLIETVCGAHPGAREALMHPSVSIVLADSVVNRDERLKDAVEVAFLPPVSGG